MQYITAYIYYKRVNIYNGSCSSISLCSKKTESETEKMINMIENINFAKEEELLTAEK
jgi:hypothetical protein